MSKICVREYAETVDELMGTLPSSDQMAEIRLAKFALSEQGWPSQDVAGLAGALEAMGRVFLQESEALLSRVEFDYGNVEGSDDQEVPDTLDELADPGDVLGEG